MTRVCKSSHRFELENTGVFFKKSPNIDTIPGHLINSIVVNDFTRLLLTLDNEAPELTRLTSEVLVLPVQDR